MFQYGSTDTNNLPLSCTSSICHCCPLSHSGKHYCSLAYPRQPFGLPAVLGTCSSFSPREFSSGILSAWSNFSFWRVTGLVPLWFFSILFKWLLTEAILFFFLRSSNVFIILYTIYIYFFPCLYLTYLISPVTSLKPFLTSLF